jgi:hypothetical protein
MTDLETLRYALEMLNAPKQHDRIQGHWMMKRLRMRLGGQKLKDMENEIKGRERQSRNVIRSSIGGA